MGALGVVGIFAALALMTVLIYRGLHPAITTIICVLVVLVTNRMNVGEAMNSAWTEVGTLYGVMVPLFIFGGVLSLLYVESGAIHSLADLFLKPTGLCKKQSTGVAVSLILYMVLTVIVGIGGIDCYSITPLLVALALGFCIKMDIPNKYAVSMGLIGMTVMCIIPGTAQTMNIMAESFIEGFNNKEQVPLRMFIMILYLLICVAVMTIIILKDKKKGNGFKQGEGSLGLHSEQPVKKMPWPVPFIPILVVEILYIAVGLTAWVCVAVGCVTALVCFMPWLISNSGKKEETLWKYLCSVTWKGANCIPLQMLVVGVMSTILGLSPGLNSISDFFGASSMPAAFACMGICVIVMGFTGTTGLIAVAPLAASLFIPRGLSAMGIVMIALWGKSVFDTLPINSMIPIMCDMSGVEFKKAYPTVFITTVIITFVMTFIVTVMSAGGLF